MIRFGPAGNSVSFYAAGFKHTAQAPEWLRGMGLSALEYSFGRGVSLKAETGRVIAAAAETYDIQMSVHAPYFINLAVTDRERKEKNLRYFMEAAQGARYLCAGRVVFHPGSVKDVERGAALQVAAGFLKDIIGELDAMGYADLRFCPETMGKVQQLGDVAEVLALCGVDERLVPAVDFGHLHARGQGAMRTKADYEAVIDEVENAVGKERTRAMHVHFSRIEFTKAGEKRHRTFEEEAFGPDHIPLMQVFAERNMEPVVICESNGTMAEDAAAMLRAYEAARND